MNPTRIPCTLSVALKPILIVSDLSAKRSLWVKAIAEEHYQTYDCSYSDFITLSRVTKPFEFSLLICDTEDCPPIINKINHFFHDAYFNTPVIFIGRKHLQLGKKEYFPEYLIGCLMQFDKELLMLLVHSGLNMYKTICEKVAYSYSIGLPVLPFNISGFSALFDKLSIDISKVAANDSPVFIDGERGCGKDIFASQIHRLSHRKNSLFNVAPMSMSVREIYESYIFGLEPHTNKQIPEGQIGKLEMLNHGSVFIDNVDLMSRKTQEKLFTFIKTRLLYRLNSVKPVICDTRVIISCSKTIDALRKEVNFPSEWIDMFSGSTIRVPSLRESPECIPSFVNEIIRRIDWNDETPLPVFTPKAMEKLQGYSWPENLDELSVVVRRAVYTSANGTITPDEIVFSTPDETQKDELSFAPFLGMSLGEVEKRFINETLRSQQGNRSAAAKILGVSQKTLYNKLKEYRSE